MTHSSYKRRPWRETVDSDPPFSDFGDWFSAILEDTKPELIVGIARSALRLLQLQRADELAPDIPILSNYALPFLPDDDLDSKRVLLFDDSVVFGSTLDRTRQYLGARGAVVSCAAYVVDRANFYGESESSHPEDRQASKHSSIPLRQGISCGPALSVNIMRL
jgi:hypothetical protein